MSDQNFDSLFNPQVDMGEQNAKQITEYQVGADKGKGGVYQSIIRFIPWHQNPKQSIQEKWVSWLVDPITQKGRYVDCPSSVGKPSMLQEMFFKLKKSDNVNDQKKASVFSRRHNFAALVQVIKDENQPELEGKILIYRFGKKIWEKINAEMKPIIGEPHNPFDLLNGKVFGLVINKVSGYNNYDQCKFVDKAVPLCMPDNEGNLQPINGSTDKGEVFEFLKSNSPDLGKYSFKEWDQETYDYVNNVIAQVTGQVAAPNVTADIQSSIAGSNPGGNSTGAIAQPVDSGITSSDISLDDLNVGGGDIGTNLPDLDLLSIESGAGVTGDLDDVLNNL